MRNERRENLFPRLDDDSAPPPYVFNERYSDIYHEILATKLPPIFWLAILSSVVAAMVLIGNLQKTGVPNGIDGLGGGHPQIEGIRPSEHIRLSEKQLEGRGE